jgi:hypothetical protein
LVFLAETLLPAATFPVVVVVALLLWGLRRWEPLLGLVVLVSNLLLLVRRCITQAVVVVLQMSPQAQVVVVVVAQALLRAPEIMELPILVVAQEVPQTVAVKPPEAQVLSSFAP